jgi:hypothetical protein
MSGEHDLDRMIAEMSPILRQGTFIMVTLDAIPDDVESHAAILEAEGWTVVVDESAAADRGWSYDVALAWITLQIHSALDAVGLTAAFSTALARKGISCNVLAGRYHDHLLVPAIQAEAAMATLAELSRSGSDRPG